MSNDFLKGAWTYRSFLNIPEIVGNFEKIHFGEGDMTFEAGLLPGELRGQLAFRSDPSDPNDARLTLSGSVKDGNPFTVRFEGAGVPGTSADGWIYNYIGYYAPNWPDGKGQVPALVGTVIRSVPHNGRPAGVVASFVAVKRPFPEANQVIPLPQPVLEMLASRGHRLHHQIWHGVRNAWSSLPDAPKNQIRALGWQPGGKEERASTGGGGAPQVTNGSGEDFLFMHRQMIGMVRDKCKEIGVPPIAGWVAIPPPGPVSVEPDYSQTPATVPTPGNPDGFSVPEVWISSDEPTNKRLASLKSDVYFWTRMRWWDREYKNPVYLATLRLCELGSLLEYSVHNDMHMRWTAPPRDPRTGEVIPDGRPDNDIRTFWDNPKYDYLGEFYSSHVNPVFWRLHGWIDDRIEDWFAAHESVHPGEVVRAEVGGVQWFKKGKWVHTDTPWSAPAGHSGHGGMHDMGGMPEPDIPTMEKVSAILFGPSPAPLLMKAAAEETAPVAEALPSGKRQTWF